MKTGTRLALASTIMVTMATAATPAAAAPAVPTFVNGMAQNVFSSDPADWITGEVWVESSFDSDGDGELDRMHANYTVPEETQTDGLKVPVIYEDSPYFAGTGAPSNWSINHEVGSPPANRGAQLFFAGTNTSPDISDEFEAGWLPRGFGVVHSESPGTGHSDGCPTSGAPNETLGATAVIDWLNGRRRAFTTRTGSVEAAPVTWHNGRSAMMGTSYNGTIPIAAASTGVDGLAAIVPISAISDWYDYYRANGLVRAPHSNSGGTGTNDFQGEDLDVLADLVYSRRDEGSPRTICRPAIDAIKAQVDRASGDRTAAWLERSYMKDVAKVEAATLIAHGGNDFNVMTEQASQLYAALRAQGTPHMFYLHQGGHGGEPPDFLANLWLTKYLWNHANGVENLPKSWVVRETAFCPPRVTTVTGNQTNTATLTVASTAPFRVGLTLTVPQRTAAGGTTSITRLITNIPDANHLTLASPVATAPGQSIADGATVSVLCDPENPTPYPDWPDPASADAVLKLTPGGGGRGGLTLGPGGGEPETLTDDSRLADTTLMNAATSPSRLFYVTEPLTQNVRISGSPRVTLRASFSKPKANFSAALVSLPGGSGPGTILTRGWIDPENRTSDSATEPVSPGTFYTLAFAMQAKDAVVAAGRRLGLMVFSTDRQFTVRPAPGTQVTLDPATSSLVVPVVGGASILPQPPSPEDPPPPAPAPAPTTLGLTLGAPATFGTFTPGVAREYVASTTADVFSSAGNATLSVADASGTGRLANGASALPQPLQASAGGAYAPVAAGPTALVTSSGRITVAFKQSIGAGDVLRTGVYSKRLTFIVSATTP